MIYQIFHQGLVPREDLDLGVPITETKTNEFEGVDLGLLGDLVIEGHLGQDREALDLEMSE